MEDVKVIFFFFLEFEGCSKVLDYLLETLNFLEESGCGEEWVLSAIQWAESISFISVCKSISK